METKNTPSAKAAVVDFCEHTTVHGLHFLVRLGRRSVKLFWTVIVIIGFVGLAIHLYNIINVFLQYKSTEYLHERDDGFNFPDVTICNLDGISASNLKNAANKYDEAKYFLNMSHVDNHVDYRPTGGDLFWSLGDHAVKVGHSLSDFVLRCKFEDQPCIMTKDLVLYPFSSFFNCFTFKRRRTEQRTITQGVAAGLTLTLFLEPIDKSIHKVYSDSVFVGSTKGVRVLLNPSNSLPGAGVMGYDILPGHSTYIAFDTTEHKRLGEPYSTCRPVDSMALGDGLTYSFTECKNICLHQLIIDECKCFPTKYKVRRNYSALNQVSCGYDIYKTKNKKMLECQDSYLKDIETRLNYANDCNCHSPCEDTKYSVTISQSGFPSENSIASFWKVVLEDNPKREELKAYQYYWKLKDQNVSMETMTTWTHKHFLKLTVYANSKTVTVKEQIPMMTEIDLMSQIGGCLGLWLGISIITVVEFFDIGFSLFYVLYRKVKEASELPTAH